MSIKVNVISLQYIFQVLYVLCFSRPRYQVSVYSAIGPLVIPSYFIVIRNDILSNCQYVAKSNDELLVQKRD